MSRFTKMRSIYFILIMFFMYSCEKKKTERERQTEILSVAWVDILQAVSPCPVDKELQKGEKYSIDGNEYGGGTISFRACSAEPWLMRIVPSPNGTFTLTSTKHPCRGGAEYEFLNSNIPGKTVELSGENGCVGGLGFKDRVYLETMGVGKDEKLTISFY